MPQPAGFTERPYLFTTAIMLTISAAYVASGVAAAAFKLPAALTNLIANIILAALAAVLVTRLGLWTRIGFRALPAARDLRLYWLPFSLVLINLSFGIAKTSFGQAALFLALAASVGFVEEIAFRGLILRAIAPLGLWRAALISSLLFGLAHSLNVLGGANPVYTLLQVGYALALGFAFAALTLRTGAIWPLVIIHALIDFAGFLGSGGVTTTSVRDADFIVTAVYILTFGGFGVLMMRPKG